MKNQFFALCLGILALGLSLGCGEELDPPSSEEEEMAVETIQQPVIGWNPWFGSLAEELTLLPLSFRGKPSSKRGTRVSLDERKAERKTKSS